MRNISLKSVPARLSVTLLLLMGSISASAQYYLNVYEKSGSNNQYEIANLDSVSISDVKEYTPVLTVLNISQSLVNLETGASTTLTVKGYDADGAEMTPENLKWKSSDYSVASVDENGVVRTYHSGNAVITALVGDISASCSVVVTDHVYTVADVVKIALDKDSLKLETGQSASISAVGFSLNGIEIPLNNVVWKSSNTSVASVEGDGLIKTYASGVSEIIALFGTISDTCVITVADHVYTLDEVVEIIIDKDTLNVETGESGKLSVRGFAANGVEIPLSNIVWKSSDYSLASVDVNGAVRTYKSGSAKIVASLGDVTDTCAVIIKDHVYTLDEVVKLSLDKVALNVETGVGDSLSVRGYAADGVEVPLSNIQWNTNDSTVAVVNENGVVKTLSSGQALVIVSLGEISDTCKVTVVDHVYSLADVTAIAINIDTLNLETGQIDTLRAIGLASTGVVIPLENILWKSNNASVALVDENGVVKTSNNGSAVITASFGLITDTCILVVVDHVYTLDEVVTITLDKKDLNLETEDCDSLSVRGYAADGVEIPLVGVSWKSTNPSIASIDNVGKVTANIKGAVSIIASFRNMSDTCAVSVKNKYVAVDVTVDSLAESGVYMGAICFNGKFNLMPIKYLNTDTKNNLETFINGIKKESGTVLYYSVDKAIDAFGLDSLPGNISKVSIVTFTDGIELGSNAMLYRREGWKYDNDSLYKEALNKKILTYSVENNPITSYTIGLKGTDIIDEDDSLLFVGDLHHLASADSLAFVVSDMSEVNKKFKEIAEELNKIDNFYTVPINIVARDNGTKVRYTFDGVKEPELSQMYIEGTLNYYGDSIYTDIEYYNLTSSSGSELKGVPFGEVFQTFTFENVKSKIGLPISREFMGEWYFRNNKWRKNEEFTQNQTEEIDERKSSAAIMLVLDCSSSLGDDDFNTLKEKSNEFIGTLYSVNDTASVNNGGGNNNITLFSKTPKDLCLAVSMNGVRYYLSQEEYSKVDLSKAVIEGLTVITGEESFIIALENERTDNIRQANAISYYGSMLPTQEQGKVISARWTYINNAIKAFGGTALSSQFWTGYYSGSTRYYVHSNGGAIGSTTSSTQAYSVRLISSTESSTPIIWRDADDLKLVAVKDSKQELFTAKEWANANQGSYEVQGVLVTAGKNKFIVALQNELTDNMLQANAITYYGSKLPSYDQAGVISARWSYINTAIKSFGGTQLSTQFWSSYYTSTSARYYVSSNGGGIYSVSASTTYPVRTVYPYGEEIEYVDLGLSVLWATTNVGASSYDEYGDYYAWGETTPIKSEYSWSNYKYCKGSENTMIKYNDDSSYGYNGFVDYKTQLDPEDDVANAKWGARIPNTDEFTELINSCTWTWVTINGVSGYEVRSNISGYTDKSIFMPASGGRDGTTLSSGSYGNYIANRIINNKYYRLYFNSGSKRVNGEVLRCYGGSIRPVRPSDNWINQFDFSLNKDSVYIVQGDSYTLIPTRKVGNADVFYPIVWTSSNTAVAKVDANGVVTTVSSGRAIITASCYDKQVSCVIVVDKYVDLGLSVKWAAWNVGATTSTGYGNYYAWGETATKSSYSWSNYKYCNGSYNTQTKYCYDRNSGYNEFTDSIANLELIDDAAYIHSLWEGDWRMPTEEEWNELLTNCTWVWTTINSTKGYKVTSKIPGYTDNYIFIPASGYKTSSSASSTGTTTTMYWSSTLDTDYSDSAYVLDFSTSSKGSSNKYYGRPIRAVCPR